jgi:hypothetical protein
MANRPTMPQPRPTDILDLRDTREAVSTPAASPEQAAIGCVANCAGVSGVATLERMPPLAVAGRDAKPASSQGPLILASIAPLAIDGGSDDPAVITCVAGCYEGDRKTMRAKGGPAPAIVVATLRAQQRAKAEPSLVARTAAAPKVAAQAPAPVAVAKPAQQSVAAVPTLKASLNPHRRKTAALRKMKPRTVVAASTVRQTPAVAAAKALSVKSEPLPVIASLSTPEPVPAPAKPERKVIAPASKKAVVGTDWFNRINREREAKAKAATAAQAD